MRKSLWLSVGGYSEVEALRNGNEDWDFWIGTMERGARVIHIPEPLYRYRRSANSMSATRLAKKDFITRKIIYRRHAEFFDRHKAGAWFRGDGFLKSARAFWKSGDYARATYLFLRASVTSPELLVEHARAAAIAVLPRRVTKALSLGKQAGIQFNNALGDKLAALAYRICPGRRLCWEHRAADVDRRYAQSQNDFALVRAIINRIRPVRLLDIGCGSGRLFPLYRELGIKQVVAQDISAKALAIARARYGCEDIQLINCPLERLRFPPGHFDLTISSRVLMSIRPRSIERAIETVCRISRHVYVNEASPSDTPCASFYYFIHDYVDLFRKSGLSVLDQGFLDKQKWMLFGRP